MSSIASVYGAVQLLGNFLDIIKEPLDLIRVTYWPVKTCLHPREQGNPSKREEVQCHIVCHSRMQH